MIIGVDFDNTIVSYEGVFYRSALQRKFISPDGPTSKIGIRDALRKSGQEHLWTELQGYVYGPGMAFAEPFAGVKRAFSELAARGAELRIVSHRTRRPYLGPDYDLHQSAREWILAHDLCGTPGLKRENIFFEETKESKLQRVRTLGCEIFIDDLPEILCAEALVSHVRGILFDPSGEHPDVPNVERVEAWERVPEIVFSPPLKS